MDIGLIIVIAFILGIVFVPYLAFKFVQHVRKNAGKSDYPYWR